MTRTEKNKAIDYMSLSIDLEDEKNMDIAIENGCCFVFGWFLTACDVSINDGKPVKRIVRC
jgi:hypothetical protein